MAEHAPAPSSAEETGKLLDENEQLRTALESSLDENARLAEDRDRLLRRVTTLAHELHAVTSPPPSPPQPAAEEVLAETKQSQAEEELRVAFEELQMLTEELEASNNSLHQANANLETRVADRTRELVEANAAHSRVELRFRTLVEGMPQLVWRAVEKGQWTWSSPQWRDYTGQSEADSHGTGWLSVFHPDDREGARSAWAQAAAKRAFDFEGRICHASEKRYRHFRTRAAAVLAPDGNVLEWLGTSTDVDDTIQLQQQQAVLVDELQHRTRNLVAVIRAIMLRTIKDSASLEDFRRCIDDRMQALARVQGLLSRRGAGRVTFDALLRQELAAHVDLDASGKAPRVSIDGPAGIPLRSSTVQTFALALHELATNAVKHGALSSPQGRLAVRWTVRQRDGKDYLHVDWRESGIANMIEGKTSPGHSGYGRELIERALPYQLGARSSFAFTEDGIHCTIEVLVPEDDADREKADG
ncbi:PAS domain-containing protein [Sphingomonas gilva]|uniref:histidine kinase n=1 Tax=Sphingomonas gilva TaxID=2305907 RepID=A0A396RP18_9SPHN|nr:HWE histidine kinase domain-containing protein [Sphingomonas gilva]RHW17536.1 PAS domain-containing protein [Sphingomonas gilva]